MSETANMPPEVRAELREAEVRSASDRELHDMILLGLPQRSVRDAVADAWTAVDEMLDRLTVYRGIAQRQVEDGEA